MGQNFPRKAHSAEKKANRGSWTARWQTSQGRTPEKKKARPWRLQHNPGNPYGDPRRFVGDRASGETRRREPGRDYNPGLVASHGRRARKPSLREGVSGPWWVLAAFAARGPMRPRKPRRLTEHRTLPARCDGWCIGRRAPRGTRRGPSSAGCPGWYSRITTRARAVVPHAPGPRGRGQASRAG